MTASRTGTTVEALALLKKDHKKVKQLLNQLNRAGETATDRRQQLLAQIENEIRIHSRIEEEVFYPAFRRAARSADAHFYFEALEEHKLIDMVLQQIRQVDARSAEFRAKAKVLKDLIEHHAEEEEGLMFPRARRVMGTTQLHDLGERMEQRKRMFRATTPGTRTFERVLFRKRKAA